MTVPHGHERMMRYLDGELTPEERADFEAELGASTETQRELALYRALKNDLRGLGFAMEEDGGAWGAVNRRVTRPLGWLLFLVGIALWLGWGSWVLVTSPGELIPKLALGAVVIGLGLLLLSVIRDQYRAWVRDPYRSIQR